MSNTEKQNFTKEIKIAYRNYLVDYDSDLLLGLIMEITAGHRGKLFVLRDKDGTPVYSYFISPLSSELGAVKDSHEPERTVQLGVPEVKVAKSIIFKIDEYGIGNIGACEVIDSVAKASYDFLYPFVKNIYEHWSEDFKKKIFQGLQNVLFGNNGIEAVHDIIKNELKTDPERLVQLYQFLYDGQITIGDIDDHALNNISKGVIWFIEQEYGNEF